MNPRSCPSGHPLLAEAIDRYWWYESAPGVHPVLPLLLPGTGAELVFHYRAPCAGALGDQASRPLPQAHVLSLRRRTLRLEARGPVGFIAVRLRTGMLHRFAALSGSDSVDALWSAQQLWGVAGRDLAERIALAASASERVGLLDAFLLTRCRASDILVERAAGALYAGQAVRPLAARLGIGERQLERRFRTLTGMAPVAMRRLGRLQQTVRDLLLDARRPLSDAALARGYADQSHFNHAFRALAGTTPSAYLGQARAGLHFYLPSMRRQPAPLHPCAP